MTIAELVEASLTRLAVGGVGSPRLDAEVLLAFAMGRDRTAVIARLREEVPDSVGERFEDAVRRRVAREPVAYIVGEKEFYSLAFRVTGDVLIPRPETELLVDAVLRSAPRGGDVLDIGTGSGCIAVAVAKNRPDLAVTACDLSSKALAVAADNARRHGVEGRVRFVESDLFAGLGADERYDVIVSNPPYVADGDILEPELGWEPGGALRAGLEGMAVIDRLLPEARLRLNPGGTTIVEFGSDQESRVRRCAEKAGYPGIEIGHDIAGHSRVVVATLRLQQKADS